MPKTVSDVDVLRNYIQGVMKRAADHADDVSHVVLALAGAVLWRMDDEPLKVFEREGEMKNVLWARIGAERYAFSYNHETRAIDMRRGSTQGSLVHAFSNSTPLREVSAVFAAL
ncbi:MAG: hypothetical protein HY049_16545 [Acidobacteria bacterium]|nr:hypothetical protein [Acidobacteriota bacterium]